MVEGIIAAIKAAFRYIVKLVRKVIDGVLSFIGEVIDWFKSLRLDPKKDTPFIADANKFKDLLKTAPRKKVGIFQGSYNEETDEITHQLYLEADEVDEQTKEVLGKESLVVLS